MQLQRNQALLVDERSRCLSVTLVTTVADYLSFIEDTYNNRGGLEGQRLPLKTKTAIKIRNRMVGDLVRGAVLPPVVIGVVPKDREHFLRLKDFAEAGALDAFVASIEEEERTQIAVIDGMQRTTALGDAMEKDVAAVSGRPVRLELWVGESTNSLIYRMLVLNTGQVPWDLKRQLETVYSFLLKEIKEHVADIQVFEIEDNSRRTTGGQYQSNRIIESYFAFTSRRPKVDVKERVAEDFARLDATDSASDDANLQRFLESLRLLSELDRAFARFEGEGEEQQGEDREFRFQQGKDIFRVRAAVVGFVAAVSVAMFGDPGFDLDADEVTRRYEDVRVKLTDLVDKLGQMTPPEIGEFLSLDLLDTSLSSRTGGVGDFERDFFYRAFLAAVKHGSALPNMVPCWRASS
ncbi:hypothetical protein AB4Y44_10460 [Paraburkholderia sp. BR10937]|uniref:hypothetical protein n=1 Tax=Paraburkholderia sp. BR10937 TaxID=3236994 RepID=UPI0034D186A7